jgi:ectoine hydroxylase-related dioxygenase (phytanoyl-CoA dioxygenase family)
MSHPMIAAFARNSRLLAIARRGLGADAVPFRATLFEKSGQRNWLVAWHQDTALPLTSPFDASGWGPWSNKAGVSYAHAPTWALTRILALRIHLDDSTSENGPLRVVAGSHAGGVLNDDEVSDFARTHKHVECVVPRGGILAMRPLIIHASSKARTDKPRRVLHIEYADSLDLGPGVRLAIA